MCISTTIQVFWIAFLKNGGGWAFGSDLPLQHYQKKSFLFVVTLYIYANVCYEWVCINKQKNNYFNFSLPTFLCTPFVFLHRERMSRVLSAVYAWFLCVWTIQCRVYFITMSRWAHLLPLKAFLFIFSFLHHGWSLKSQFPLYLHTLHRLN